MKPAGTASAHRFAWQLLVGNAAQDNNPVGSKLLEALLDQHKQLELEIKLQDAHGRDQHLWLVLRLPEKQQDYNAVILSISDITSPSRQFVKVA